MLIFDFIFDVFKDVWTLLFSTKTLFGFSFGIIFLGISIAYVLWNVVLLALGISSSDFSSLGSPKDYFRNKRKEKQAYVSAADRFRSKHHGKLVDYNNNSYVKHSSSNLKAKHQAQLAALKKN